MDKCWDKAHLPITDTAGVELVYPTRRCDRCLRSKAQRDGQVIGYKSQSSALRNKPGG